MRVLAMIVVAFALSACGQGPGGDSTVVSASTAEIESEALTPDTMAQWARSCALCHVRGEGGAPVLGDTEAWAGRVAQGEDVLLGHTLEGYNNMPPLGYCMDCEEADFRAIIAFMSASGR